MGVCAGKKGCVGGKRCWDNRHVVFEYNGFGGELINVWRLYPGISVTAEMVGACCVKRDYYDMLCR